MVLIFVCCFVMPFNKSLFSSTASDFASDAYNSVNYFFQNGSRKLLLNGQDEVCYALRRTGVSRLQNVLAERISLFEGKEPGTGCMKFQHGLSSLHLSSTQGERESGRKHGCQLSLLSVFCTNIASLKASL
jgi:hypothetical protein